MQIGWNEMELSAEQKKEFIKFLNAKWNGPQICPICKDDNWIIPDIIFEARDAKSSLLGRYKFSPLIELLCGTCGYILYFNPIISNIYKRDNIEESNGTEGSSTGDSISKT